MRVASAPGVEVRTVFGALNFRDIVSGRPGVTDLLVSDAFGAPVVFAVSRDGLARYGIGPGGAVTATESVAHGGAAVVGAVPRLLDTAGALYLSGFQPEAAGRLLGPGGLLGAGVPLLGPGRAAFDMARVDDGAGAALVVQATGAGGLDLYREAAAGELTTVAGAVLAGALGEVRALDVYDGGAAPVLLALSRDGAALTAMTVEADALMATGRIDAASGVGLAAPGAIAVAAVAGQGFAVIGSAGGGALTVAGIGVAGELWLADHVLDTRDSRFAGTTAVEAIEVGDFAFVAAGGADDGVSLFTLLPDGRLVHLASLADAVDTTLAAVSALALYVADGALQVLVASASEAGMTRLSHDVSALGAVLTAAPEGGALAGTAGNDIVAGGAGDDALSGAGGADLLADGAGADVLTGGAGADLFILSGDGTEDRITDFTPGEDRLDLSDWRFFYGADQLSVAPTADGAVVVFRGERLEIASAAGVPLSAEAVAAALWTGADRPPLVPVDQVLGGGAGDDTLLGGIGADTISGGTGEDRLVGGPGDDVLKGDAGFDVLLGGDGADRIEGGAQADTAHGGAGDDVIAGEDGLDTLYGDAGADVLDGGAGNDRLRGGDGDDVLRGGTQEDLLWGEAGADRLEGNAGFDRLEGGDGSDWLDGGAQADVLYGGTGDDVLLGGDGFDRLFGGAGADLLDGGEMGDGMFGEGGDDVLLGRGGDDRLNGGPGNDLIDGGAGADELFGGAGFDTILAGPGDDVLAGNFNADTFVFTDGFGADVILDFEAGNAFERIDLSAVTEITDWADLVAAHMVAEGADVRISAGADSVVLLGVALGDLDPGDFVF